MIHLTMSFDIRGASIRVKEVFNAANYSLSQSFFNLITFIEFLSLRLDNICALYMIIDIALVLKILNSARVIICMFMCFPSLSLLKWVN